MLPPSRRTGNQQFVVLLLNVVVLGLTVTRIESFVTSPFLSHRVIRTSRLSPISRNYHWRGGHDYHGSWFRRVGKVSVDDSTCTGPILHNDVLVEQNDQIYHSNKTSEIPSFSRSTSNKPSPVPEPSNSSVSQLLVAKSWRSSMPLSLQKRGPTTFQKLGNENCTIYVLGTAHLPSDSADDVATLLHHVNPDCIFVELCPSRVDVLYSSQQTEKRSRLNLLEQYVTAHEVYAESIGLESANEFRRAYEYWKNRKLQNVISSSKTNSSNYNYYRNKYRDCYLVLGDRPAPITLLRASESLDWKTKLKLGIVLLLFFVFPKPNRDEYYERIRVTMDKNSDKLSEELNIFMNFFPTLYKILVEERDLWMSVKIVDMIRTVMPLYENLSTLLSLASKQDSIEEMENRNTTRQFSPLLWWRLWEPDMSPGYVNI